MSCYYFFFNVKGVYFPEMGNCFHHLKLEIALAIPALDDEKYIC